ncbi:type II inositol 3,4-bisphosphate 4-phosphatase isoform X1, partial [Tachysurus ichikawai]
FKNPVCKVYRFQTTDSKWMLVREQMAECTLSFSVPIQLLRLFIQEDRHRYVIVRLAHWKIRLACAGVHQTRAEKREKKQRVYRRSTEERKDREKTRGNK